MLDIFVRVWNNLVARTEGPMYFRFFLQPAVSLFFAIRAALRDSHNNTVPFLWRIWSSKGQRTEIAKEGWKDVGKIFIVGTVLDIIYQAILIFKMNVQDAFYPLESLIVAFLLAIVPYILFRGPVNRIVRLFKKDQSQKS